MWHLIYEVTSWATQLCSGFLLSAKSLCLFVSMSLYLSLCSFVCMFPISLSWTLAGLRLVHANQCRWYSMWHLIYEVTSLATQLCSGFLLSAKSLCLFFSMSLYLSLCSFVSMFPISLSWILVGLRLVHANQCRWYSMWHLIYKVTSWAIQLYSGFLLSALCLCL
jgi:hypothetical protein